MEAAQNRPPYVDFETRPMEDREATIEAGRYMTRDVDFALITPQGSKDKIEKEVSAWLKDIAQAANEGRFPGEWVRAYEGAYKEFKERGEVPESGTPILGWALASPSLQQNILSANIRTVEDLAEANEETLARIGMGARMMKERAISWLDSAEDTGKVAASNEALKTELKELKARNEVLEKQVKTLEAKIKEDA